MEILNQTDVNFISGGNPIFVALGAGVAVYIGTAKLVTATHALTDLGHTVGEQVYNSTHSDQLGPMIYPVEEPK